MSFSLEDLLNNDKNYKSLQDLCIEVIVNGFDRYYSAFTLSNNRYLIRHFEFLQRVYSKEIVTKLYNSGNMEPHYVDFLINKFIKELNTDWMQNCSWETIAAKMAEIGPNLQKIAFCETNGEILWQNVFHHLNFLEKMKFQFDCNDEILKCVAQFCPNIVKINVAGSPYVTSRGLEYLCKKENGKSVCPKLKKLSIVGCGVLEDGVKCLIQNLQSLEEIDYRNLPHILYSLHEKDLSSLDKIESYNLSRLTITHLHFEHNYIDILKICLSLCRSLKSLSCTISNQEQFNLFYCLSELEKLNLDSFSNARIDITDFLKLKGKKLKSLTVHNCSLSVSTLAENCPCLKELYLNQVTLQNDDNISPTFRCLETCIFDNIEDEFTNAKSVCLLLRHSAKLQHIGFKRCDISSNVAQDEILKCCQHCSIKKVNFKGSEIHVNFIREILINCHTLKSLILEDCDAVNSGEYELISLAQWLPNRPNIIFDDDESVSDDENFLDSFYDPDYDFEEYDDEYDDFYNHYDDDDDDDDDGVDYDYVSSYFDF